jgi:PAS domain S-box-containing protein
MGDGGDRDGVCDESAGGVGEQLLYRGERTQVVRVPGPDQGGSAIRKDALDPGGIAMLRHEVAMLRRLTGVPGVPRVLDVSPDGSSVLLTDSGGSSLDRRVPDGGLDAVWVVGFAVRLGQILGSLHRAGVVHKDINPANILLCGDGPVLELIDFGLAMTAAEERPGFTHLSRITGTLPYLAPEQTGRTGRPVDARADLYGLGATLYELLTDRPPFGFATDDPLPLIHAHLAQLPAPPSEVNPAVPPLLSAIVMHLLEKEPDQRYQSAEGLLHDLARVRAISTGADAGLADGAGAAGFRLGERDFPPRLSAPSRLVGRQDEVTVLADAYQQVCAGRVRGLLVSGSSGVGKTALLDELRPLVTRTGGWFLTGKFDQYRQDPTADAVAQVLRGLGRMLLAEPEAVLAGHRQRLRDRLGQRARLLAGLPELGTLLEVPAEPLEGGDPNELAERLLRTSLDLLRAVASPQRPLVIVLDDLQWASAFPLRLVDGVVTDDALHGVLLVGAYRDAEVDAAHPLSGMLARWERLGVMPEHLKLANLPPAHLGTLLAEMLRLPADEALQLAGAIGARSGGNPFDTVELLNALRRDGALTLQERGWRWDAGAIRRFVGAGDVADLLSARLAQLPADTRGLLQIMACLGGGFDLSRLAACALLTEDQARDRLAPALEDGLVISSSMAETSSWSEVRFRHDRVQQAAFSQQQPQSSADLHLTLARRLSGDPATAGMAAEQYLSAVEAMPGAAGRTGGLGDSAEVRRAVALFLRAAAETKLINAAAADRFLVAARDALASIGVPDDDPQLADALTARYAVLCTLGRLDEADQLYPAVAAGCAGPGELVDAACLQIASLTGRHRPQEAIALGAALLARLGVVRPGPEEIGAAIGHGMAALCAWAGQDPDTDLDRPPVADPRLVAAARVMDRMMGPSFYCDHATLAWLVVEARRIWAEEGPCAHLVCSLATSAMLLAAQDEFRIGYAAVRRVLAVAEARGWEPMASQARFLLSASGSPWFAPLEVAAQQARQAREGLLQGGDLHHAGYSYQAELPVRFEFAPTLDSFLTECQAGLAFGTRTGHHAMVAYTLPYRQLARALRGETQAPGSFTDDGFDEQEHAAAVGQIPPALAMFHTARAVSAAVFGDVAALLHHAPVALSTSAGSPGVYCVALARVVAGLALAQRVRSADDEVERARLLAELDSCRDWLRARAQDAPVNGGHLAGLLAAERAWAAGEHWAALEAFDGALHDVDERSRPWHHALLAERAARCHLERGMEHAGRRLLAEAHGVHLRWGAAGKARELVREFPFLRDVDRHPDSQVAPRLEHQVGNQLGGGGAAAGGSLGHSIALPSESIDLLGVLRASQALSTETNLDRLRSRVVDVLTMMSGATGVKLALWNDDAGDWFLPASDGQDGEDAGSLESLATDEVAAEHVISVAEAAARGLVPISAFRYAERTMQPLRVDDAVRDDRFARDPYLAGVARCSLLVVPILSHGSPRAMLLLENRLTRRAFSPDRLDAVMLIAGQLAVCLDNALAERFRSLVQRSSELTLVCRPPGTITYASSACTELLGAPEHAVLGAQVTDLVHPDDRAGFLELLGGRRAGLACRLQVATGSHQRWVETTITDLTGDPAVRGLMLRLRDITERRRLETELRHAQKLESVGQLASGIAHEINTPIQFIGDNVRFLTDAFCDLAEAITGTTRTEVDLDDLLEEIPQALRESLEGAARIAAIVRAMKAFGDPGTDSRTDTDLNEAVRNTLVVATSQIRPVAVVELDLDPALPPLWCIPADINQVILTLVRNAVHAMADQQPAPDQLGVLAVRTRSDGDHVVLQVADTGTGIPDDIADRVFDQFFTTKPVGVGSGQGLALAHTLVHDRHQGTITFTTTPGKGTTFTMRLPCRTQGR